MAKGQGMIRTLVEWAAVLLVALGATLLLTSAAAHAECVWVLWRHGRLIGAHPNVSLNEPWRALGSWSSRTECETNKPMYAKRDSESFETPEAKEKWRYLMREYAVQAKVDLEYLCFPDTMDPREWKKRNGAE